MHNNKGISEFTTIWGTLIFSILYIICLTACAKNPSHDIPTSPTTSISAVDISNVVPNTELDRIISLTPSLTETLCDLGLGSRLLAITSNDDYPPEILNLPNVGDINPNWEKILSLHPNAVLIDDALAPPITKERLKELKIPTISTKILRLSDLLTSLPQLGKIFHCENEAEQLEKELRKDMETFKERAKKLPKRPRVYIEVYSTPLMTAGAPSLMSELLDIAGGENIYKDIEIPYPNVSAEDLLMRDPDIVVLTSLTLEQAKKHPQLGKLRSICQNSAIEMPSSLMQRATKRSLQSIEIMQNYFEKNAILNDENSKL